jgi:NAD(P)-dependent dehydrogenase (short-subunit alcohol dehydrogenase family)
MNDGPLKGRVALVTGANRGIGFEVCRQLARCGAQVILTARDSAKGAEAAEALEKEGLAVSFVTLDATDAASIAGAARKVEASFGRLDVVVNNAGGLFDMDQTVTCADLGRVRETLDLNLFGPWLVTQAFLPLLRKSAHGHVVMVSSAVGSHADPHFGLGLTAGVPAYGVSKAALNALTAKLAGELKDAGILVNAVCPGFTATQPGMAERGARPVADGAAGVTWACYLPDDGPTGGFFRDGKPIPW